MNGTAITPANSTVIPKIVRLLLAALLGLATVRGETPPAPAASPAPHPLRVLELRGSGYERGLQHGRELKTEIAAVLGLWKADMRKSCKAEPEDVIRRLLAGTNYAPAIQRWTPALWDEIRGIADGAEQPFETILAFQLMDELWVFADRVEQEKPGAAPASANHCSSIGVARTDTHPAFVAQTMDLETFRDGYQVVLHISANSQEPEQYVLSCAGLIGVNGMNRNAVAITCNTLMELTASTDGLPVACVVRGFLAQPGGDASLAFIRTIRHASGQNYIVGVGDRVFDFEASANKVVLCLPLPDGSVVFHTNHPLANNDWKPWHRARWDALPPAEVERANSVVRLYALRTRLTRPAAEIDHDVICATLRSKDSAEHPICGALGAPHGYFTFAATIMTLSDAPSFAVTMGPPDRNPFVHFAFNGTTQH